MKSTDAVEVVYPLWVDCLEGGVDINDVIKLSWNWYNETITERDINHD
jgi:hypothetical protein